MSALKQGAHIGAPLQKTGIKMDGYTNMKRHAFLLTLSGRRGPGPSGRGRRRLGPIRAHPQFQELHRGPPRRLHDRHRGHHGAGHRPGDQAGHRPGFSHHLPGPAGQHRHGGLSGGGGLAGRPARALSHPERPPTGSRSTSAKKTCFSRPGDYTYTIRYRVDRELGFFKDFDELYWNVTGNGWTFAIDRAEAYIELPPGAKILKSAAYTGYQGDRGHDFTVQTGDHDIVFKTTRRLAPKEGLTVAVSWPKGVVHEPSGQERVGFFLRDNVALAIGLIWLAVLLGFYLWVWYRVGRDPASGTIIPLYAPPSGFSPAGVRFVSRMGYDDKAFAAAVVDMAVKGGVLIQEDGGDYTLVRRDAAKGALSRDEQLVIAQLFLRRRVHQIGKRKPHQ